MLVVGQIGGTAYVEPIIFILGPSGVGKSYVAKALKEDYAFLHLDIDQNHGFERNGFPKEWDKDFSKLDCAQVATHVRTSVAAQQRNGAVLSFPTAHVFSTQQIRDASRVGISTIVIWGPQESCLEVRRERQTKRIGRFSERDLEHYRRTNRRTFEIYARAEYAGFRVVAFRPDGSRWPREHLLELILARTAGPPSACIAGAKSRVIPSGG